MNFGASPGDIATIVNLAYKAYSGWKRACGEYGDITSSLDILLINLERIQREAEQPNSVLLRTAKDRNELGDILSACEPTVRELHNILLKYTSLGQSRQRNWDRLRFGIKNLNELRTKLTGHITAIGLYLNTVGVGASTRIERDLQALPERIQTAVDYLAEEIRAGRREGSILTTYGDDEKEVWEHFRGELIGDGMTSGFIHRYKSSIKRYLRDLAEKGELEERALELSDADNDEEERRLGPDHAELSEAGSMEELIAVTLPQMSIKTAAPLASDFDSDGAEDELAANRLATGLLPRPCRRDVSVSPDGRPRSRSRGIFDKFRGRSQQSDGEATLENSTLEPSTLPDSEAPHSSNKSDATMQAETLQPARVEAQEAEREVENPEPSEDQIQYRRPREPVAADPAISETTIPATKVTQSSPGSLYCPFALALQTSSTAHFRPVSSRFGSPRCPGCKMRIPSSANRHFSIKKSLTPRQHQQYNRGDSLWRQYNISFRQIMKSHTPAGEFVCVLCYQNPERIVVRYHATAEALVRHMEKVHTPEEFEREVDIYGSPWDFSQLGL